MTRSSFAMARATDRAVAHRQQELDDLDRAALVRLVAQLQGQNRDLVERPSRRRCGSCGAQQRWRAGPAEGRSR
jgi:hypothetical protein